MEINLKLTISFLLPAAVMLLMAACGGESQIGDTPTPFSPMAPAVTTQAQIVPSISSPTPIAVDTSTRTIQSTSSSFSMGLPFEKSSPPDGIMPMGETVNHSNPGGHGGLDFQWDGNPIIVAVASGKIVDLVAHQHQTTKVDGYYLSIITGKYIVNYTQLGEVNPELKPGDTVEKGDFLGHPSPVQPGHNTRMIHWDFGTYDIFTNPYKTPEGLSLMTSTNRLCPLEFFESQALTFLEEIWKDAWWEHRDRFPLLCNPPWDK